MIVAFVVEQPEANIILYALIGSVLLVGIVSFGILQWQKKRAENKRILGERWNRYPTAVDRSGGKFEPTAPPISNRTSWAYAPFRYSQRSTLPYNK